MMVQAMVLRLKARELIPGLADDPTFGNVVVFGRCSMAVEIVCLRSSRALQIRLSKTRRSGTLSQPDRQPGHQHQNQNHSAEGDQFDRPQHKRELEIPLRLFAVPDRHGVGHEGPACKVGSTCGNREKQKQLQIGWHRMSPLLLARAWREPIALVLKVRHRSHAVGVHLATFVDRDKYAGDKAFVREMIAGFIGQMGLPCHSGIPRRRRGIDLLREIRVFGFDWPVIVVTGQDDATLAVKCCNLQSVAICVFTSQMSCDDLITIELDLPQ